MEFEERERFVLFFLKNKITIAILLISSYDLPISNDSMIVRWIYLEYIEWPFPPVIFILLFIRNRFNKSVRPEFNISSQ